MLLLVALVALVARKNFTRAYNTRARPYMWPTGPLIIAPPRRGTERHSEEDARRSASTLLSASLYVGMAVPVDLPAPVGERLAG